MDFQLNDEQLQLKKSVREFAEREIAPHVMEWDEDGDFPMA
ncbi:MAG: acyl-CoA dehydrogenase family protein, partial [Candidatus Acidiferrales bacterium]